MASLMMLIASTVQAQYFPPTAAHFQYVFDIPGGYVNDHCLIREDTTWHLFFIQGKQSSGNWDAPGNEVIIGHATSSDLLSWKLHEPALRTGDSGSLDAGHIYAPAVVKRHGIFHMFYTGNEQSFNGGEHLGVRQTRDT
jgi:beta-fructofuranosidase